MDHGKERCEKTSHDTDMNLANGKIQQQLQASSHQQADQAVDKIQSKDQKDQLESPSLLNTEDEATVSSPRKQRLVLKRQPYSKAEQQQIVDYIINTKSYKFIKGVHLWQEMQKDNAVCKGRRTWQSMKEHFLKQVTPQLHIYKNVNEKVASRFRRVLMGLQLDLADTDSSEENENQAEKRHVSTQDEYDKETDPSGSESELKKSYQSLRKRRVLNVHQSSPNLKPAEKTERDKRSVVKTRRQRDRISIAGGDTTEEEEDFNTFPKQCMRKSSKHLKEGNISEPIDEIGSRDKCLSDTNRGK